MGIWSIIKLLGKDSAETVKTLCRKGVFDWTKQNWDENNVTRQHGRFAGNGSSQQSQHVEQKSVATPVQFKSAPDYSKQIRKSKIEGYKPIQTQQCVGQLLKQFPRYSDAQWKHNSKQDAIKATELEMQRQRLRYEQARKTDPNAKLRDVKPKSYFTTPPYSIASVAKKRAADGDYKVFYDRDGNARMRFSLDEYSAMVYNPSKGAYEPTAAVQVVFSRGNNKKAGIHMYPITMGRYKTNT